MNTGHIFGGMVGGALVALVVLVVSSLSADEFNNPGAISRALPYEGVLDFNGAPAEGQYNFEFAIYPDATNTTPLWGFTAYNNVEVEAGRFSVVFTSLPDTVFEAADAHLAIRVNGQQLSGRQRLHSVPFSVRSAHALHAENALNAAPNGSLAQTIAPHFTHVFTHAQTYPRFATWTTLTFSGSVRPTSTHPGDFNTSTGVFTPSLPGIYVITVSLSSDNWENATRVGLKLVENNNTSDGELNYFEQTSQANAPYPQHTWIVHATSGDSYYAQILLIGPDADVTLDADPRKSYFKAVRVSGL